MKLTLRGAWMKGVSVVKGLKEADLDPSPFAQFGQWFADAERAKVYLPESMALATVSPDGKPGVRMVLLKGYDERGFVFFTNYESRKSHELEANAMASLLFHWSVLERQVRIEGRTERVSEAESAAYFASRGRGSQLGAWASHQSAVLAGREELEAQLREIEARFKGQEVPLPSFWGGYRLVPDRLEFWQGRVNRLHDRLCYTRKNAMWSVTRLAP